MFKRDVFPVPEDPIIKTVSPGIAKPLTPFIMCLTPLSYSFTVFYWLIGNSISYLILVKVSFTAFFWGKKFASEFILENVS
jgi:hypothetical protein